MKIKTVALGPNEDYAYTTYMVLGDVSHIRAFAKQVASNESDTQYQNRAQYQELDYPLPMPRIHVP
jgi:hypothetical protein